MNIFNALSQGKGNLNEENLTAMLGFLLNSYAEHGLNDTFLRKFLSMIDDIEFKEIIANTSGDFKVDITFESPYEYHGKLRRVDIDLRIYSNDEEQARILIENKIRANSADRNQFKEEYLGVISEVIEDDLDIPIFMVFLTPSSKNKRLVNEYESLHIDEMKSNHHKTWIYWDGIEDEGTISYALKRILIDENQIIINPISEYVRHTIKALIRFINDQLVIPDKKIRHKPMLNDEMISSFEFDIDDIDYRIEEYVSSAIKVINLNTEEYVVAKPILREVINILKMPIKLQSSNGRNKNTRQLGKDVMKHTHETFKRAIESGLQGIEITKEEE